MKTSTGRLNVISKELPSKAKNTHIKQLKCQVFWPDVLLSDKYTLSVAPLLPHAPPPPPPPSYLTHISVLFAFSDISIKLTKIKKKIKKNTNKPDTLYLGNEPVQRVKVGETALMGWKIQNPEIRSMIPKDHYSKGRSDVLRLCSLRRKMHFFRLLDNLAGEMMASTLSHPFVYGAGKLILSLGWCLYEYGLSAKIHKYKNYNSIALIK